MAELRFSGGERDGGATAAGECRHKFCPESGLVATDRMRTGATGQVLRGLLRPLAALVFGSSVVFLVRDLWLGVGNVAGATGVAVLVFGAITAILFGRKELSLSGLRGLELILYATLVAHLAVLWSDRLTTVAAAGDAGALASVAGNMVLGSILVMTSYALFVPNTWQRALLVVVPAAIVPVALFQARRLADPDLDALAASVLTPRMLTDLLLPLGIGLLMASMGVALIARFRDATFSARAANLYDLREQIGVGGMGEVWRAEHHALARPAAIKIIRPELLGNGNPGAARVALRRFEREAQATAGLRSPHTVDIYDYGVTQDGVFFYMMEYLDGVDLDTLVERHGPLPAARAVHILRQACLSLADAHAHGLVHRDVKPANIYVCRMGMEHDWVKVLDFGLVKEQRHDGQTQLTVDGLTSGTPAYLPPEMALGDRPVSPATDVYALGCVAYWLLTGKLVFQRDTPMAMIVDHVKSQPEAPSRRTELPIPPELDEIVLRCLAKDPADRYASMKELAEALEGVRVESGWSTARAEEWWRLHLPEADLARAS